MKSILSKKILTFYSCVIFYLFLTTNASAQNSGFSGVWIFDEKESILGSIMRSSISDTIFISVKTDTVTITRNVKNHWTISYAGEGVSIERIMSDNKKRSGSIKFLNEKSFKETATNSYDQNNNIVTTQTSYLWQLSENSKSLTCNREFNNQNGVFNAAIVYHRN